MTAPLAFVDTETTGLDADRHEIWEVGLIVDGVEHHWFLPVRLATADPFALNIGRYYERHPLEQPDVKLAETDYATQMQFVEEFAQLTIGRHLVGAVISFDEERLRRLIRSYNRLERWHYHLIDVEALTAGALAEAARNEKGELARLTMEHAAPPWNSDDLSNAYGVDPGHFDRHTALGDARWAKAIYEAVMGLDQ